MVEIHEGVGRPQFAAELLAGNHFPGPFQQRRQYLEGLFLQLDFLSLTTQFAGAKIDLKDTETNNSG